MLPRAFFDALRKQHGINFEEFIRAHLIPLRGDLDKPLLGFSPDVTAQLQDEVRALSCCTVSHMQTDSLLRFSTFQVSVCMCLTV